MNGFDIVSSCDIPDYASKGIYLRHRETGLEVFHLFNTDTENMFAFVFRTPPWDSSGIPHILEHSVLCGSKRYPLKDPFIRLSQQSVNTYLNAMTFPDKTVFPASSVVESDYFNLMSVYGDAVFFPTLSKEAFMQEAWHLETDGQESHSIQGVVYNEMKGEYSSFDSVASTETLRSILPDTVYAMDSGGDPLCVPSLTQERLKAFHAKYYCPENCLVFLYGNIPTEKQLEFIQRQFLCRMDNQKRREPLFNDIMSSETVRPFKRPSYINATGPATDDSKRGDTVTINWLLGESSDIMRLMECVLLEELLSGHDGSPLQKALLESGLGEDIAPDTGLSSDTRYISMTAGLRGVSHENAKEVEAVILKTLENICREGFSKEDIESSCMSVTFSNREVKRSFGGGPYSLTIMRRALRGWTYGKSITDSISVNSAFSEIRRRIDSDKDYCTNLVRSLLLENLHRCLVCVTPTASYSKKREEQEKKLAAKLLSLTTADKITQEAEALHEFQKKSETEEQVSLLPHLNARELSVKADTIETDIRAVKASSGDIPLFINTESTNGVRYVDVAFPLDCLQAEDYQYLPFFASAIPNCGWGKLSWDEAARAVALDCGGFNAALLTSACARLPEKDYEGRDWISFRVKMLEEKTKKALKLLSDCITKTTFSSEKRLRDLAREWKNDFDESIVPSGHEFAILRANRLKNHALAVDEIWNGASQLFVAHKISETPVQKTSDRFSRILSSLRRAGAIIHVTADKESMPSLLNALPDFADAAGLLPLSSRRSRNNSAADMSAYIAGHSASSAIDICTLQSQVGFAALSLQAASCGEEGEAEELVLSHWLSNTLLWECLRTVGGSYGAFAVAGSIDRTFSVATYRDPHPFDSLAAIRDCLCDAARTNLRCAELERAITGSYSKEIHPHAPAGRGWMGLCRKLYCVSEQMRLEKIERLLSVTPQSLKRAAERLYSGVDNASEAVLCNKAVCLNKDFTELPV